MNAHQLFNSDEKLAIPDMVNLKWITVGLTYQDKLELALVLAACTNCVKSTDTIKAFLFYFDPNLIFRFFLTNSKFSTAPLLPKAKITPIECIPERWWGHILLDSVLTQGIG